MAGRKRKWSLVDLVDFEDRLLDADAGDSAAERRRYREEVGDIRKWPRGESDKRRLGLRAWLEAVRGEAAGDGQGARVVGGVRVAGLVLGVMAFLGGISLIRGMLQASESGLFLRGYNVGLFLALTLGVQWLLLLGGIASYFVARRARGTLSLLQRGVSWVALKMSGVGERSLARSLLEGGAGYRSVLSWRIARLSQWVAIAFNLGLLAGLYGCLRFLSIRFYWESTFEGMGWGIVDFMEGMAMPWAWSGRWLPPGAEGIDYSVPWKIWIEKPAVEQIAPFLMMSLFVYGMLPRVLMWIGCVWKERRALAVVPFQAPRHRELWRRLTKVEQTVASEGQADGVVLLDVGGTEVPTEKLRGFLLRELRVNPEARFTAAVLDGEGEREAMEAIRKAELGVVFLVEGWALSPQQMRVLHARVRSVGGAEIPVHMLVMGELRGGELSAPDGEEWSQWRAFVDSLRDPATEAVAYREPANAGGEP
jgi:hypothetical protein